MQVNFASCFSAHFSTLIFQLLPKDEDTKLLNYLFMGSVTIPLAPVLRFDGFVRCTTPDYIVGYTNQPSALLPGDFDDGKAQDSTRPAQLMLRVHATTDPIVMIPTKSLPNFLSNESAEVLSRVKQWSERYLEGTNSTVLWSDIHGFGYLASRFLTAQNPPNIRTMTLEACAHYVSLIPLKRTWRSLERLNMSQHLVLNTTQTLDILAGDATEHAVLLANYFLYLGKKNPAEYSAHVYLVLAEGRTVSIWLSQSSHDENSFNLCPTFRYGSCVKAAMEMSCFGRLHLGVPFPVMTTQFRCRKSIA
jgi:hypothetical protein